MKSASAANAFAGEILAAGVKKALRVDVAIPHEEKDRLSTAGLVVVNPPFDLADAMESALAIVAPRLGGRGEIRWLAGGG